LLRPIPLERFVAEYWERAPLLVSRSDPSYYDGLFSLPDADQLLSDGIDSSHLRIARANRDLGDTNTAQRNQAAGGLEALYQDFRDGTTIVFRSLNERWSALTALSQNLSAELSARINVNAYLTPPGSQGLSTHYDTHDVFVLQTSGTKHWRIYHSPVRLPLKPQPTGGKDGAAASPAVEGWSTNIEAVLQPGDLLYIPRGFLHDATSLENTSLHLTVGVYTETWGSLLKRAILRAVEQDERLRESLPVAFGRDVGERQLAAANCQVLTSEIVTQLRFDLAIEEARLAVEWFRPPHLQGHLVDLERTSQIDRHTRFQKRATVQWVPKRKGGSICLSFHGKDVAMPAHVGPELEFIGATDEFSADDLPVGLDDESKLVLLTRLVTEGALKIMQPSVKGTRRRHPRAPADADGSIAMD